MYNIEMINAMAEFQSILFFIFFKVYLFVKESTREQGERQKKRERNSGRLSTEHGAPVWGLNLMTVRS